MDLVDWDEAGFREIERDFAELMQRLGVPDGGVIPVSALHGDNVVEPSDKAPWYDGPPLLSHLEQLEVASRPQPRRPAAARSSGWCARPTTAAPPARWPSGVLRPGDEVLVLPQGERTTIARIDTLRRAGRGGVPAACRSPSCSADDLDVGRGDLIAAPGDAPPVARRLEARVCWMADAPATRRRPLRAQAHHAPRARADRVDRRAARRRAARGRAATRASWRSTTSAACTSTSPRR